MISRELRNKVLDLLTAIQEAGIFPLVKENHAYETLLRIVKTGTSLPHSIPEPEAITEITARTLADPITWGIFDPTWKALCEEWRNPE